MLVGRTVGLLVRLAWGFQLAWVGGGKEGSRIEPPLGLVDRDPKVRRQRGRASARAHVANGVESILGNLRQFQRVQLTIERADLPLRAGELLALCVGLAFVCGLLTAASASPTLVTLGVMAAAGWAPYGFVSF